MKLTFLSGGARAHTLSYLIAKGEAINAVITPIQTEKNNRFQEVITVANTYGIPVHSIARTELAAVLAKLAPDIMVSCGYTYILDEQALQTARYAINVHPTLLPKYRGARSGPYVILNGEKETGVTVHFMTNEMDRGEILVQKRISLTMFDTQRSVYRKLQSIEPEAVHEAIQILKSGNIVTCSQDESKASVFQHMRTPEDSRIDPSRSLIELYNEIRACDPESFPAFFEINGQKICIKLWRPDKPAEEIDMI